MKEKVYEVIKKSGKNGIRLRDIGYYCDCWHCSCVGYAIELVKEGRVYSRTINRGWEAYIKYYAKEV